jgi:putative ABC transport system permease protein
MEALAIPLRRGRRFAESDAAGAQGVAIVNEEMAKKYWPGRDPIGERVWFDSFEPKEHWLTVVGVAGNVRQSGLTEPVQAQAYVCYSQVQIPGQLGSGNLMVRTAVDPRSLAPAVRRILREANSEAAATFRTMDDVMAGATARQRFQMQVLAAFAALALMLAAVGLYGVMAYSVASNRVAIGIRMALGAQPPQLFRMVALHALWLTSFGAAIGLGACLMLRGVLAKVVFGVGPSDPRVLAASVTVMLAVALPACWFPARRAMHVDPVRALREE